MARKGIISTFELVPVHLKFQSEKEGRPIYKDVEYIRHIPMGDNKTQTVEEVTDKIRQEFPDEYKRFKSGMQESHIGTPLKEWAYMRPAQIKELNYLNVFTVEHLAELGEDALQRIGGGGREIVKQAKAYLERAKESGATNHYAAENERLKGDIARLQEQMARVLADRPNDEPVKRGPGRPPKVQSIEPEYKSALGG